MVLIGSLPGAASAERICPGLVYGQSFGLGLHGDVAAMNDPAQQEWLNAVYSSVYDNHIDYYEDSVNLLCMLVMSGNFWSP